MTDQLLPCPFCGKQPKCRKGNSYCITINCPLYEMAICSEDWNTRAQPASAPKPVKDDQNSEWENTFGADYEGPLAYVLTHLGEVYYEADDNIVISNFPGDELSESFKWVPVFTRPAPAGVVPAAGQWREGAPPHPWDSEWFLAKMSQGQFVVLRPLPEEWTYDFTTADGTYVMRKSIVKWAQLSGSEYVEPDACREETARLNGVKP